MSIGKHKVTITLTDTKGQTNKFSFNVIVYKSVDLVIVSQNETSAPPPKEVKEKNTKPIIPFKKVKFDIVSISNKGLTRVKFS